MTIRPLKDQSQKQSALDPGSNVSNTALSRAITRWFLTYPKAACPGAQGLFLVSTLLLILCSSEGRAQETGFDRESYYRAVDYCRRSAWPGPMNLSPDKQVLCFTGEISQGMDVSLANDLKEDGLFVVRSYGGNPASAIALSDIIRDRHATVVVYDHCFSACASFLLVASYQTYVLKGALVAWHHPPSDELCTFVAAPRAGEPRKLQRGPCQQGGEYGYTYSPMLTAFFKTRAVNPPLSFPPDSLYVRKIVRNQYAETAVYHNVMWTLHPRYYPGLFKTKIFYEAYPESQTEVDDIRARLGVKTPVIYDW